MTVIDLLGFPFMKPTDNERSPKEATNRKYFNCLHNCETILSCRQQVDNKMYRRKVGKVESEKRERGESVEYLHVS